MKLRDLKEAFDPKAHAQKKYEYFKDHFVEETASFIVDGLVDHFQELQQNHEYRGEPQRFIQDIAPHWIKDTIDEALEDFAQAIMVRVEEKAREKGFAI